jgi:hypothetical protein
MPGLVCAATTDSQLSDSNALLRKMADPIHDHDWYTRAEATSTRCVMASVGHSEESCVAQDGALSVVVSGAVYDCENPAVTILERYQAHGLESLYTLNGQYAIVIWDGEARELHALTDRLGCARLHYWQNGDTLFVATQLKSFIWHPDFDTRISEEAVLEYLVYGCNYETDTLLASARSVPDASVLTWKDGTVSVDLYWDYDYQKLEPTRAPMEYAEELVDIMRRAVKRATGNRKPILGITGGYDSRFLAAVVADLYDPEDSESFTLGSRESWDVVFGEKLAHHLRIPFTDIPIPSSYYAEYAVEGLRRAEGAFIGHTCYRMAADEYLRERSDGVVLNGYRGDYYHGPSQRRKRKWAQTLESFLEKRLDSGSFWVIMGQERLKELVRPKVYQGREELIRDRMRTRIGEIKEDDFQGSHMRVQCHTVFPRRYGRMQIDYLDTWCPVRFPFCDIEQIEFATRLPRDLRMDALLPKLIFEHIYPDAGKAPHTATGKPLNGGMLSKGYHGVLGWAQFKAMPALTLGKKNWRNRKTYVHYAHWLRTDCRAFVERVLAEEEYLEDLVNMDYVRRITADVMEERSDDYGPVYNLATLALFRKYYCERRGKFEGTAQAT